MLWLNEAILAEILVRKCFQAQGLLGNLWRWKWDEVVTHFSPEPGAGTFLHLLPSELQSTCVGAKFFLHPQLPGSLGLVPSLCYPSIK